MKLLATPRLSAVAQRRLHVAQAPEPSPTPVALEFAKEARLAVRHEETTITKPSVGKDELARKRAEIERKLVERVRTLEGGPVIELSEELRLARASPSGRVSPATIESPSSKGEESALARVKRQREEKRLPRTTTDDEDIGILSAGGRSDEDEVMESVGER
jgi:hypothetical protein